jgi:hypothetical protein
LLGPRQHGLREPGSATVADLAAVLFVHTVVGCDAEPGIRGRTYGVGNLLSHPTMSAGLQSADSGRAMRLLLAGWAATRPLSDLSAVGGQIKLAMHHPLPELVPQLVRIVNNSQGGTGGGEALVGLAKTGAPAAVTALSGMLDDPSNMWVKAGPRDVKSELRACALGALAKLKGKEPTDYGLVPTVRWTRPAFHHGGEPAVVQLYGFPTENARTDGLAKWRAEMGRK